MKIALYARVSTSNNGQDPETQLIPLREYVKSRNFGLYKEYVDVASGIKESRPSLDELLNDARKRKFDTVIVWKLDRLGRSLKHLIMLIEEFQALGVQFISYTENIDTTTSTGKLLFSVIGAIASFERDLIRERVKAGLVKAKTRGVKLGRPTAKYDHNQVYALNKEGKSTRAIAKELGISNATVSRVLQNLSKIDLPNAEYD